MMHAAPYSQQPARPGKGANPMAEPNEVNDTAVNHDDFILTMTGICKTFPGVVALDDVDFSLRHGEIHA